MRLTILCAAFSMLGVACESAPSDPTWHQDVKPILVANCIKCHGAVPRGGAPSSFRLDRFGSDAFINGDGFTNLRGASQITQFIHTRTDVRQMPPTPSLSGRQIDVLQNWFEAGAPALGTPADNAAPEIAVNIESAAATVTINYVVSDADYDPVAGRLTALGPNGALDLTNALHSGSGQFLWQTESVPPGDYQLSATLSDEVSEPSVDLGSVTVSHANTSPTITILSPASKSVISDAESPFGVRVLIEDPDVGDTADVTVSVVRGTERIELATAQDLASGTEATIDIDTTAIPEGPNWTLVVESGTVTASAKNIIIGHGAPQSSFAPIQGILDTYCSGCHDSANPRNDVFIPLPLDEGDVFGFRGGYFFRVVQEQSMPPRSAEIILEQPRMPSEAREALRRWILTAPDPNP